MPIYLTGKLNRHTDSWKHYHDDILPLGMIVQPKTYREGYLNKSALYKWVGMDNGRFTPAGRALFSEVEYRKMIDVGLERARDDLLFVTAPDEPFDWHATLKLSWPWLSKIRAQGACVALCAQEGMELSSIPWDDFDCLFIGGNDAFKEGALIREACREARRRTKWVHMGRVNTLRRMLLAQSFGVDSVDGTYILHEEKKGRHEDAVHDIVGWLRTLYTRSRNRRRRDLLNAGLTEEQAKAWLDYHA
jgi:hypothetical protein